MPPSENWAALWPKPDRVLRLLGIRPGMAIVEFCGHDGYFTVPLAKLVRGNLFVFDVDSEALNRARAEISRSGASVRGWIWDDPEDLAKVLPEPVDVVFMANVMHGVSDKQELARAIWPALNPKGRLIIIDWHRLPRESTTAHGRSLGPAAAMRISPDELCAVIEPAGFRLGNIVDLPPYHYGATLLKQISDKK